MKAQLMARRVDHDVLLERIPAVPDLQAAWLLLSYCASARANFALRTVATRSGGRILLHHMTLLSGNASRRFSEWMHPLFQISRAGLCRSHSLVEDLGFRVLHEHTPPRFGQVGLMKSHI